MEAAATTTEAVAPDRVGAPAAEAAPRVFKICLPDALAEIFTTILEYLDLEALGRVSLASNFWLKEVWRCQREFVSELDPALPVSEYDVARAGFTVELERMLGKLSSDNEIETLIIKLPPHEYDTEPEVDDHDEPAYLCALQLIASCPKLKKLELELYVVQIEDLLQAFDVSKAQLQQLTLRTVRGFDLQSLPALASRFNQLTHLHIDSWLPPTGKLPPTDVDQVLFPKLVSMVFPARAIAEDIETWTRVWRSHSSLEEMALIWADSDEDPVGILTLAQQDMDLALQRCRQIAPVGVGANLIFLSGQRPFLTADTLLTDSVRQGDEVGVLTLIAHGINLNLRFRGLGSVLPPALHVAIQSSHLSMVNLLLDGGADLTLRHEGCTPLFYAFQSASPEIRARIFTQENMLKCSSSSSSNHIVAVPVIDTLLRSSETYVHALGDEQWFDSEDFESNCRAVFDWAASKPEWFGVAVNLIDYDMNTPLHRSKSNISFPLFDLRINPRSKNVAGKTAIEVNPHVECTLILIMWYRENCSIEAGELQPDTPEFAGLLAACANQTASADDEIRRYMQVLIKNASLDDLASATLLPSLWLSTCWDELLILANRARQLVSTWSKSSDKHFERANYVQKFVIKPFLLLKEETALSTSFQANQKVFTTLCCAFLDVLRAFQMELDDVIQDRQFAVWINALANDELGQGALDHKRAKYT